MQTKEKEKKLKDAVLVFLIANNSVLLATKMKKIGKGRLNGYGGGIEAEETSRQAAMRELEEETRGNRDFGVTVNYEDLEKVAIMDFHNTTEENEIFICKVHVFLARSWEGLVISTEDMANPTWYKMDNLPLDKMCPADKVWLPLVLSGKKIRGFAKYGPRQETLIGEVKVNTVDCIQEE